MGGFIILDDGRAYAATGWAFRDTVASIADALPATHRGIALANWLRNDPTVSVDSNVDVREFAPVTRELFLTAVKTAFKSQTKRSLEGRYKTDLWKALLERLGDLVKMIDCVDGGKPADEFNPHMQGTIPPTGRQSGPGW